MDNTLVRWDNSLTQAEHDRLKASSERRRFLQQSYKATAGLMLLPSITLFNACDQLPQSTQAILVTQQPWKTFVAVQMILFPADGNGPSATDINATAYLKFVLEAADTDTEDKDFVYKGVDWLNQLAQTNSNKIFIEHTNPQQQELIKQIAKSRSGERWLSFLINYIFEALLSDPVYGGNPDGIGWQWLTHQPGFPRPPQDKTYIELQKK
jgi:gluconate 2-dehydrogenase gamma chain